MGQASQLPFTSFENQMRGAVHLVASTLPDRNIDRGRLAQQAIRFVVGETDQAHQGRAAVLNFIASCPKHYGVPRRQRWWKTMRDFFSSEEILGMYLVRFPEALTQGQLRAISEYLCERGFGSSEVAQALAGFRVRQNAIGGIAENRSKRRPGIGFSQ